MSPVSFMRTNVPAWWSPKTNRIPMFICFVSLGVWVSGGPCVPLSTTFKLVLALTSTAMSTNGYAFLELPASNNGLPVPGTDYSIMISASSPGVKVIAQTADFAIASPTVTLSFQIIQTDPAAQLR